ncbi:hypothetical protein SCHPADRAFT_891210 [Schizopora paradoxa]|uniref:Methyltransferase n=1 Tax=Schizopora paradoxa TaxID=27342 RepID=A0A0H2RK26_9AGAM|nr:hypothetical protein SCHPADRAFT_891210 [Schizopora paradoxa]
MTANTIEATLIYTQTPADGSKVFQFMYPDPITGERKSNHTPAPVKMVIEDLRGKEDSVTLDEAGFQFVKAPVKHTSLASDEEIQEEYYPESIELLKKLTGASKVICFDHTIRRRRPGVAGDTPETRQPAAGVHVDQTEASAIARLRKHLSAAEADELLKHRFQIINIWRPIGHPAFDHPLALCDFRTVNAKTDLVPGVLKFPDMERETFVVKHNPAHKWKYVRGMTPDEIVLIKCYDSVQDGSVAIYTPHTAFEDPTTPPDAPLRESIELRFFVFYED